MSEVGRPPNQTPSFNFTLATADVSESSMTGTLSTTEADSIRNHGNGAPMDDTTTGKQNWNNAGWQSFNFATGEMQFEVPFLLSVAIIGVIGNILVLVVYLQRKFRKTNAALYIINLAIGKYFVSDDLKKLTKLSFTINSLHTFVRIGYHITLTRLFKGGHWFY